MIGMDQKEFAKFIENDLKAIKRWESDKCIPPAPFIKKLVALYNLPLEYWGKYYYWYYNQADEIFLNWKDTNKYGYEQCTKIFSSDITTLHNFATKKVKLTYQLYIKLSKIIFD